MEKAVKLYENERYSPIYGWCSRALLLTDRKNFSSSDGKVGWTSHKDAEKDLISRCWKWLGKWELENEAEGGWSYSTDFKSFDEKIFTPGDPTISSSPIDGIMRFVRRRCWIRKQILSGMYAYLNTNTLLSNAF